MRSTTRQTKTMTLPRRKRPKRPSTSCRWLARRKASCTCRRWAGRRHRPRGMEKSRTSWSCSSLPNRRRPGLRDEPPRRGRNLTARRDSSPSAEPPRQTRVDVPQATRANLAAGVALFLQTFTWVSCLLVILVGGVVYVWSLVMTADPSDRLAASGVYAALVVASYFLARSTERVCRVLGQWFGVSSDAKTRRTMRERNWSRFQ